MIEQGEAEPKTGGLADRMVEIVRDAILRGRMLPGQHLAQTSLAEEHAISKVPVREALKQLHAEGLLEYDRNRGYFVARISRVEAEDLYALRRWIESELLRSARWPTKAELAQLKKRFDLVARPISAASREKWLQALSEGRQLLFGLSPRKTLLREAMRLWTLTDRFRALLPDEASATGEMAMYEALVAKDRDALLEAHAADRDRIEDLLEEMLSAMPAYWMGD